MIQVRQQQSEHTFLLEARPDRGALLDDERPFVRDRLCRSNRLDQRFQAVQDERVSFYIMTYQLRRTCRTPSWRFAARTTGSDQCKRSRPREDAHARAQPLRDALTLSARQLGTVKRATRSEFHQIDA